MFKINLSSCFVAHDVGMVTLQVFVDGRPVSTTAMFEYRQHEYPLTISSLTMPHTPSLLKFHLLQKLDTLEDYLQPNGQQLDNQLVCKTCGKSLIVVTFLFYFFFYARKKVLLCSVNLILKIDL